MSPEWNGGIPGRSKRAHVDKEEMRSCQQNNSSESRLQLGAW